MKHCAACFLFLRLAYCLHHIPRKLFANIIRMLWKWSSFNKKSDFYMFLPSILKHSSQEQKPFSKGAYGKRQQPGRDKLQRTSPAGWSSSSQSSQITELRGKVVSIQRWFHRLSQTPEADTGKCPSEMPRCVLDTGWHGFTSSITAEYQLQFCSAPSLSAFLTTLLQGMQEALPSNSRKRCLQRRWVQKTPIIWPE